MYSIAQIIYGVPLILTNGGTKYSENLEDLIEGGKPGFLKYYSGIGEDAPVAFGVEIDSVAPNLPFVDFDTVSLKPDVAQAEQFATEWYALSIEIRSEITQKFGRPRIFFLWVTS